MVGYKDWESFVGEIRGKIDRGEIIPDPEWQRGYIWKEKDEQLLIDSILRGLPIPKFYLTQEYNTEKEAFVHYAVDGQQRLKAIYRFMNNRIAVEIDGKKYYFRDLENKIQQKITGYKLNGHYMTNYTQADINFLFQRLNRTGIKLTNMEVWNNEYFGTNIIKMIREIYEEICGFPRKRDYRDYEEKDYEKLKNSYMASIYADENIKRMLPLDDIIDVCNCLHKHSIEGGSKRELEEFLGGKENISDKEKEVIKSRFRKVINNIREIFSKQELEPSLYSKRTHFISLFLAVGLNIPKYYILGDKEKMKENLLNFIENQPEEYKKSVFGAIRQKAAREKRVSFLSDIILKYSKKLDTKRLFDESLKRKFWRNPKHVCELCKQEIKIYKDGSLDHIEPWAKGGETKEYNAQLAHKKCNKIKRDKYEEFIIF